MDLDLSKAFEVSNVRKGGDEGNARVLMYTVRTRPLGGIINEYEVSLWYEARTGTISKRTVLVTDGFEKGLAYIETYSDLNLDAKIPDEKFILKGP